jgi:hypothetical protein
MAFQYSGTLRTNQVAQLQATIGSAGVLKIFSGAEPANCAAPDPAGLLCTINLPATFLASANGAATLSGTWSGTATLTGTAASFRMYDSAGTCHVQGNTTNELVLANTSLVAGQAVTVTQFTVNSSNS